MKTKIEINSIISLKNGLKGKVVCQLLNGEYLLASGKGGQISCSFKEEDVEEEEK